MKRLEHNIQFIVQIGVWSDLTLRQNKIKSIGK